MIDLSIIKTMIQQDYAMQEIFDKIDELQQEINDEIWYAGMGDDL